jgi:hypothetical protein
MTFDIAQYELKDTATVEVELPNGSPMLVDGKQVTITVYGGGSKEYLNAKYKMENANQAKLGAVIRGKVAKNAAEENTKEQAKFLASCTAEVKNIPLTPLEIYSNPKLAYVTEQVNKFLGDDENFM